MPQTQQAKAQARADWLTKEEGVEYTGLSLKHLERLARERRWPRRQRPAEGRKPETLWRRKDLEAARHHIARAVAAQPKLLEAPQAPPASHTPQPQPYYERQWLSLSEMEAYLHPLPAAILEELKAACRAGTIGRYREGRYYFRREELDQF
ncbi:MAG TPA: hypothetical protein VFA33_07680 [Bryobacteraceae bacterium]|nr:hypothetical protein [Bryobacteraceae bacterium]